jgi:hypothetical protein
LQFELWIGDAAAIRAKRVRKQKTDRQDAQLILSLLLENRFPKIWVPSPFLVRVLWLRPFSLRQSHPLRNVLKPVVWPQWINSEISFEEICRFDVVLKRSLPSCKARCS